MKKILIWDIPIRLFHWTFSACIIIALFIALSVDNDSSLFNYHIFFGLSAGFLLLIRFIIAIFGNRYTRFSGLFFSPVETIKYLITSIAGKSKVYIGHNPGTAGASLVMFVAVIGLILSGLNNNSEFMEEIHPVLAYILLAVVLLHLLGILLFTLMHKENIALSMFTGRKNGPEDAGIKSSQGLAGFVTFLFIGFWFLTLSKNFDPTNSTLNIPFSNNKVSLGESENESNEKNKIEKHHKDKDDDDD